MPTSSEKPTHRIPEPEATLNLLNRVFDTQEGLLQETKGLLFSRYGLRRIGLTLWDRAVKVIRGSVKVGFCEDAESGVDVGLERQT